MSYTPLLPCCCCCYLQLLVANTTNTHTHTCMASTQRGTHRIMATCMKTACISYVHQTVRGNRKDMGRDLGRERVQVCVIHATNSLLYFLCCFVLSGNVAEIHVRINYNPALDLNRFVCRYSTHICARKHKHTLTRILHPEVLIPSE